MNKFEVSFYSEQTEESRHMIVHAYSLEDAEQTAQTIKCQDEYIVGVHCINPKVWGLEDTFQEFLQKYCNTPKGKFVTVLFDELRQDIRTVWTLIPKEAFVWDAEVDGFLWEANVLEHKIVINAMDCAEGIDFHTIEIDGKPIGLHIFFSKEKMDEVLFIEKGVTLKQFIENFNIPLLQNETFYDLHIALGNEGDIQHQIDMNKLNLTPGSEDGEDLYDEIGIVENRKFYYHEQWSVHVPGFSRSITMSYV